jgi:Phycobilisome protein
MAMPTLEPTTSLRKHPELSALFKSAENRHFTNEEFSEYERVLPDSGDRARAAREIAACEQAVVERVVGEIFTVYPYEKNHAHPHAKCMRDIRSVSAYATLSMLMNDPHWFRDKLLLWLRTILQSFHFPDREVVQRKALFGAAAGTSMDQYMPNQRSIYETYVKLKNNYREKLSTESFALIEPFLDQAINTLAAK